MSNSYAADGKCHNAEPGSFNHECGKPATWIGTKADGFASGFCDHCKNHGSEARSFEKWRRIDQRQVAVANLLASIDQLKAAFGAPGDYGYSTREGKALFAVYQAASTVNAQVATEEQRGRVAQEVLAVVTDWLGSGSLPNKCDAASFAAGYLRGKTAIAEAEGR